MNHSLLGLACGDSYGSYYEMDGLMGVKYDIKQLPNNSATPIITDDTKMAIILLQHYRKYKNIDVEKLYEEYRAWAIIDGKIDGIGLHTAEVLLNNKHDKDSQGNGALMRVIPFGVELIKDGYSFEETVSLMNRDSAITHANETIFMANRLSLDIALNGISVIEKVIYKDFICKLHNGCTAWVMHSLCVVIETLKMDISFLDGFKHIVSKGGDTDTNCAIYGAIRACSEDVYKSLHIADFLTKGIVAKLKF